MTKRKDPSGMRHPAVILWSGLSGVVAAAVLLATAELVALVIDRNASPLLAVGSFVIDIVPRPLKELAIAAFGAYDKIALLAGLGLAAAIGAAIAGVLEYRRMHFGVILLSLAGLTSALAVATRAGASPLAAAPTVVGTVAGGIVLLVLIRRLRRWSAGANPSASAPPALAGMSDAEVRPSPPSLDSQVSRRSFFLLVAIAGAAGMVAGATARVVNAATSSVAAVREALRIPAPRTTVPIPEGADLGVPGISELFTPNAEFYRVDTALTVPSIDPGTWRLVIDGRVDRPVELSYDDLIGMGLDEYAITLTCVSNEVGGELVGAALWTGVPVRDLLALAGPTAGADMLLSRSVDGYTASTPLSAVTDPAIDAILAVTMNGEPLPVEHGFPVRMVVPGLYGYVSATKWLTGLTVTTFAEDEAYWTPRGYSAEAPIKLSSRIDTPKPGRPVTAGRVAVAGVAWAQTVGIERVEVRIDDGDWEPATLSAPVSADMWVQWFLEWDATPGTHYLTVRAVDRSGRLQIEERAPIAPNGSSGWQRTLVTVT